MFKSKKAQLFSLDLMLAPIAFGMSANAMSGVTNQMQEYSDAFHMKRAAMDAADVLIKTSGVPEKWNNQTPPLIVGLAVFNSELNRTEPNRLDIEKIGDLTTLFVTDNSYLSDLWAGEFDYYNLSIYPITNASTSTSWFENVSWSNGTRADMTNIVVIERFAYLENGTNDTFVGVRLEVGK